MFLVFPARGVVDRAYPVHVGGFEPQTIALQGRPAGVDHVAGGGGGGMAAELTFRDLTSKSVNESLQSHNALTFKLVKTVADFTQQLSSIHEQHAEELQLLVETFRKRNAELRRERPPYQSSLCTTWEVLLQEVEVDSQVHGDIARSLGRSVGMLLLEKTFYRKIQSRKIFLHRESLETILSKAEELLKKCHQDYSDAYQKLLAVQNHTNLAAYYDMHNAYVQQLHAANGMVEHYYSHTLPKLLEELEEVYEDLSETTAKAIQSAADLIAKKAREQSDHYQTVSQTSKATNSKTDLANFIRTLNPDRAVQIPSKHAFSPPYVEDDNMQLQPLHALRDELVIDRLTQLSLPKRSESLRQEINNLESQIRQLQESLDSLLRLQQRSLESCLYNKSNELQEDISMKRFDLEVANIHLCAVRAQIDLFAGKDDSVADGGSGRERKISTASTTSIKNKWLKAFKSLKTGGSGVISEKDAADKKSLKGRGDDGSQVSLTAGQHIFQEYTYKKITPCDVCREVLRGHVRQGLKCKMCKMNVHAECQEKVGRCQPKPRLLRRQKSTSEIESRITAPEQEEEKPQEVDPIYQLLKQAGDLGSSRRSDKTTNGQDIGASSRGDHNAMFQVRRPRSNASSSASSSSSHMLSVSSTNPHHTSSSGWRMPVYSAPHSPQRKKLSLRMKSFSLDSPESTEHVTNRRGHQPSSHGSSHSQSPQSPVQGRRQLLSAKTVRMSSVDLPDDNEKSLSNSASPSPCPSPKPHRLLPTNLYVVLYNFRSRHQDELDLKAGYTVTVTDTSDPDWWQGKCLGRVGFFPSKYVTKLHPGERPLQVTHTIQISDGENGVKLLRDQIVIQIGDECGGIVTVRTGTSDKTVACPLKYLQEV